jgi:mono/diheme cytochrome c family protein
MAGGRPLETPFGTFYSTNITADERSGIGRWSDEDFLRAMRYGRGPDGTHYFPIFPYTSFTGMSERDLGDLKAYLFSLEPVDQHNRPHELRAPFGWRAAAAVWQWLYFEPAAFEPDVERSPEWNRGKYVVTALAHCGECHTPRTRTGAVDEELAYAGSNDLPDGELAPNITPDPETGVGEWSVEDMTWFLETGIKPDGDDTQGSMSEVIEHGYSQLEGSDREAIAVFVRSLPAIVHEVRAEQE